jgi:hypothetical protein
MLGHWVLDLAGMAKGAVPNREGTAPTNHPSTRLALAQGRPLTNH